MLRLATGLARARAGMGAARQQALDMNRRDRIQDEAIQRDVEQEMFRQWMGREQINNQVADRAAQRDYLNAAREDAQLASRENAQAQAQAAAQRAAEERAWRSEEAARTREAQALSAQQAREFQAEQNRLNRENMRVLRSMGQGAPKNVPGTVANAYLTNNKQLRTLDDAIAQIEANPQAVGLKAMLPGVILNRMPGRAGAGGVDARAGISDVGSLEIRDRSGAAVTAAEWPRLRGFIPEPTDDHATALKKLRRMRAIIAEESQAMSEFYSPDQGYRGLPPTPSEPAPRTEVVPPRQGAARRPPLSAYPGASR